jgi:hypothetical protein
MSIMYAPHYDSKFRLTAPEALMELYGDWLFERREFKEAALGWWVPTPKRNPAQ